MCTKQKLYSIYICIENSEIRETLTTFFSSGTKRLLPSWLSGFFTRGERETHNFYYADCSYIVRQSTPQLNSRPRVRISTHWPNKRAAHPVNHNWTGLAQVQKSTNFAQRQISTNCFFQKSPKFRAHRFWAWRHSHPNRISYLGFLLWHLWLSRHPRASVNCTQCVHLSVHWTE